MSYLKLVFLGLDGRVRNGWKILGFFALVSIFSAALQFALKPILPKWIPGQIPMSFALLAAGAICLKLEGEAQDSIGLRLNRRWGLEFLVGTGGGFLLMMLCALVVFGARGFHWVRTPDIGIREVLAGAWLYLWVAVFEELAFRGYFFQRFIRGSGVWIAQIVLALFFAYAHWHNPGMVGATKAWATLNIALAAVLLGLCYLRTGSLALPIGVHLGWNWTQGNLLGFGVSGNADKGLFTPVFQGRPEWLTGGSFGLEASLPCALLCGAACLLLAVRRGRTLDAMPELPGASA